MALQDTGIKFDCRFPQGHGELTLHGPRALPSLTPALSFDARISVTRVFEGSYVLTACSGAWTIHRADAGGNPQNRPEDIVRLPANLGRVDSWEVNGQNECSFSLIFHTAPHALAGIDRLVHPEGGAHSSLDLYMGLAGAGGAPSGAVRTSRNFQLLPDEWRRLLPGLGFERRRVFELRADSFTDIEQFEQAVIALDHAQQLIDKGQYAQAVAECRLVVENVLRPLEYTGPSGNWQYEALAKAGLPREWNDMLRSYKKVVNAAAHRRDYRWGRPEAVFVLGAAASLASYLGQFEPYSTAKQLAAYSADSDAAE